MELTWHEAGSRRYETGVHRAAFYPQGSDPAAWNGVISVTVAPSGGEPSPIYANRIKIADILSVQDLSGSLEAFTCPDTFLPCLGYGNGTGSVLVSMQKRKSFGLVYQTLIGNDLNDLDHGSKLHIYYGCHAQHPDRSYSTMSESTEMLHYRFSFTCIPVLSVNFPPVSYICVDSTKTTSNYFTTLTDILYGKENTNPYLPTPDEIRSVLLTGALPQE